MARVKYRDFSAGLHVTAQADIQSKTSLRKARNIAAPVGGRLRAASCPLDRFVGLDTAGVDALHRYQNILFAEMTKTGTHKLQRETAIDGDTWVDVTLPAGYGSQPAVVLVANSRCTEVLAPLVTGGKEALFLLDRQNVGANLFKITDPTTGATSRWGILPPVTTDVTALTSALAARNEKYWNGDANADPFDSTNADGTPEWTLASADEDGLEATDDLTRVSTPAVDGNALRVRVGKQGKDDAAQITRIFTTPFDATTFGAVGSSDQDYVQFYVRIRRPKRIDNIEIAFDTNAGDYKRDFFTTELSFELVKRKKRRTLIGLGDLVPTRNTQDFLKRNADKVTDLTFSYTQGKQKLPVAKNTWTRVTIPKAAFDQSGNPSWATVKAIRVTFHANENGRTAVFVDGLKLAGGVGMSGDYQYTFTYGNSAGSSFTATSSSVLTRSNPAIDHNGVIGKISVANVDRQGVTVTFPNTLNFDPQADRIEIWRTVGNGEAYFKVGDISLTTPGTISAGSNFTDKTSDYIGFNSTAAGYSQVLASGAGTFNGNATLDPFLELPIDNDSPNDPSFKFQDAVGLHVGRMWWTRNVATTYVYGDGTTKPYDAQGQVYYSPAGRPESVVSYIQVTSGKSDPVQKLVIWNDRLFAFTTSGMYEVVGTDEPFVALRIEGAPGTTTPDTVAASQNGIFWRAFDGIYQFGGVYAQNISDRDLQPIFKWNEAVEDFAAGINFNEAAIGKNAYWLIANGNGLGGSDFALVFDFETASGRYREASRFLFYDAVKGRVYGAPAASTAKITDLEPVPFNVTGSQTFSILTAAQRVGSGQKGVLRKVFLDANLQGATVTPFVVVDGVTTNLSAVTNSARGSIEWTVNIPGEVTQFGLTTTTVKQYEIYGIELDFYAPALTIGDSGLRGDT